MCNHGIGIHVHKVETSLGAPTAALRCDTGAYSFGEVDSTSLAAGDDLLKSFCTAFFERKYFSGQSAIKISESVHAPSLLRYSEIRRVKHAPFDTIPEFMNFMEDSSESFPAGVIEKPRHVFKEKKLRPFGFSHPCDFMKESSSGVGKAKSPSAD